MEGVRRGGDGFESRRRKEQMAFLVVKFLKAYEAYQAIYGQFLTARGKRGIAGSGLFDKVRALENDFTYDIKELAHALFRTANHDEGAPEAEGRRTPASRAEAREAFLSVKGRFEARVIDCYIGSTFHILMILRESLYQIERYMPEYEREQSQLGRIEQTAREIGHALTAVERREIGHLHALTDISGKLRKETEELAQRMVERCRSLFQGTSEVLRHLIESSRDNEVLVQNMLQHEGLLERVYGAGAADAIFREMCGGPEAVGATGKEMAREFAVRRCGNSEALAGRAGT